MTLRPLALALLLISATAAHAQLKAPRDATLGGPSLPSAASTPSTPAAPKAAAKAAATPTAKASAPAKSDPTTPTVEEQKAFIVEGQRAALGWLMLLDRKDWGSSWTAASATFRKQVPLPAWMDGIPKTRDPLGAFVEREPAQAAFRTTMPGQPDGSYVSVAFVSKFTTEEQVEEFVATVREADGTWRVIGYSTR